MICKPLVCICIPTYNAAHTVGETLASILAQTYTNLVIHVSDNASTDGTIAEIESLADPRIVVHRNEKNIGGEGNFNRCIQLAEGKYSAIFHADDLYEPEMVERQVAFLEANPGAGAVFTEAKLIDEHGDSFGQIKFPAGFGSLDSLYDFNTLFKAVLRHSNFLVCPSVMVRTEVYKEEIKLWRGDLFRSSADLDVWLRIAQIRGVGMLPLQLMRYRISSDQFSANLRARISRADFFLVMDYYLAQPSVQVLLTKVDRQNYSRLERTDSVVRAVNLYLQGDEYGARELCKQVFSAEAVVAAFSSRRNLITVAVGWLVSLLALFRLSMVGRPLLRELKRIVRK
jgi:glycosyltransferase involved in cell wall biosynthesis